MRRAFLMWLQRRSASDPGLYPRLAVAVFFLVALLWWYFNGQTEKKAVAVEALWFQLGGAGLLWWEANATPQRISLVIREVRRAPKPNTVATTIVSWIPMAMFYLSIATIILSKGFSRNTWFTEVEWLIIFTIFAICIWQLSIYSVNRMAILRKNILAAPADEELLVRRWLRTIGFAILLISTVIQLYPALASDGNAPNGAFETGTHAP